MPLLRDCKSSKLWAIEMPIARADKWVWWYLSATREPTCGGTYRLLESRKAGTVVTIAATLFNAPRIPGLSGRRPLFATLADAIFLQLFIFYFYFIFSLFYFYFFFIFPLLFFSFFIFSLLFFSSFVFPSSIFLVRTNRWEDCWLDSSRLLAGRLVLSARGVPTGPSNKLSFCKSICTPTYLSYYH